MPKEWLDERSTGRRNAREVMYEVLKRDELPYACQNPECGKGPSALPPTVPSEIAVLDPEDPRRQGSDFALEVNHINKNLSDVNEANLKLLCKPCHRAADSQTAKGESAIPDEFGYGFERIVEMERWPDVLF